MITYVRDLYGYEREVTAVFTQKEWSRIGHVAKHSHVSESKEKVTRGQLQSMAASLWGKGTLDHEAMSSVGVELLFALVKQRTFEEEGWSWWGLCYKTTHDLICCGAARERPTRLRWIGEGVVPTQGVDEADGEVPESGDPTTRPVNGMGMPATDLQPADDILPSGQEAVDADDATLRAESKNGLIEREGQVFVGVVGGMAAQGAPASVVGVITSPTAVAPCLYARCEANAKLAVQKRIREMVQKPNLTCADKKQLKATATAVVDVVFTKDAITTWAAEHPFESLRSKKWSAERFELSMEEALADPFPVFAPAVLVKVENTLAGKAPRALIDDKAYGQIMALASISCFEKVGMGYFRDENIKSRSKEVALDEVAKRLSHPGKLLHHQADVMEGDGRAYDAKCSKKLRDLIENLMIARISSVLEDISYVPSQWLAAHIKINRAATLRLKGRRGPRATGPDGTKGGNFVEVIDGIRRSGHRGTSCLNWVMNKICWAYVVFGKNATEAVLDAGKDHCYVDRWGEARRYVAVFEGDDSILAVSPRFSRAQHVEIPQIWTRLGFDMKIFVRNEGVRGAATFVGNVFATSMTGLRPMCAPDIPRVFRSGCSKSAEVVEAWGRKDESTVRRVAAAAAVARARGFARFVPTLARKFLDYADELAGDQDFALDRETQMQIAGAPTELTYQEIADETRQVMGSVEDEAAYLLAIEKEYSRDELATFLATPWHAEGLADWKSFRESLPAAWRPVEDAPLA